MSKATAVTTREDDSKGQVVRLPTESEKLLAMIERVSTMPDANIQNLERLYGLFEKMKADEAKRAFTAAFNEMKPKLPVINRKGRIEIREKVDGKCTGDVQQSTGYARWEDIDEAITPILHDHGFTLSFRSGSSPEGKIIVTAVLDHVGGHRETTDTPPLMHDSTGSKNAVQAVGSSLSYGKRISATLLLNIRTKGEDDDGKSADAMLPLTDEQAKKLNADLEAAKADKQLFCEYFGIEGVAMLPQGRLKEAETLIAAKATKKAAK